MATHNNDHKTGLSSRGLAAYKPPMPYLDAVFEAMKDPYHKDTNSNGYINMAIAENKLTGELLLPKLAHTTPIPEYCLHYNNMNGNQDFRAAIAQTMARFVHLKSGVNPNHVACSAGATPVVDSLAFCLCEPGDAVIIPAPFYAAFVNDFQTRSKVHVVPAYTSAPLFQLSRDCLDAAHAHATEQGWNVRMLLISNPVNPTGYIYPMEELKLAVSWANEKNLHLVCDEIYALSVFAQDAHFESIAAACDGVLGDCVHIVYGLSKDFGMSGIRVGVLYSENEALITALGNLNAFSSVSGITQHVVTNLLNDTKFVDEFLAESSRRLKRNCDCVVGWLKRLNIPHTQPLAGMLIWADFRSRLPSIQSSHDQEQKPTFEHEMQLYNQMFEKAHVLFAPGQPFFSSEPGYFRICFSCVTEEAINVAFRRLEELWRETL